jgi:hypothetical protein
MSEVREGIANLMKSFDCNWGDELAGLESLESGAAVWRWGEVFWVSSLKTGEDIDLRECERNS